MYESTKIFWNGTYCLAKTRHRQDKKKEISFREFSLELAQTVGESDSHLKFGFFFGSDDRFTEFHRDYSFLDQKRRVLKPLRGSINPLVAVTVSPLDSNTNRRRWQFQELIPIK